jgi:exonuclease VII small subunit
MGGLLKDLQPRETVLSPETSLVLAGGFVEEQGCVLLASQAHNAARTRVADTHDETGYECFINHLHIKTLQEAMELARRLRTALADRFTGRFAVIVSFDAREATVRFHRLRTGQAWLSDNLEEYEEGIAVLDSV